MSHFMSEDVILFSDPWVTVHYLYLILPVCVCVCILIYPYIAIGKMQDISTFRCRCLLVLCHMFFMCNCLLDTINSLFSTSSVRSFFMVINDASILKTVNARSSFCKPALGRTVHHFHALWTALGFMI